MYNFVSSFWFFLGYLKFLRSEILNLEFRNPKLVNIFYFVINIWLNLWFLLNLSFVRAKFVLELSPSNLLEIASAGFVAEILYHSFSSHPTPVRFSPTPLRRHHLWQCLGPFSFNHVQWTILNPHLLGLLAALGHRVTSLSWTLGFQVTTFTLFSFCLPGLSFSVFVKCFRTQSPVLSLPKAIQPLPWV